MRRGNYLASAQAEHDALALALGLELAEQAAVGQPQWWEEVASDLKALTKALRQVLDSDES